MPLDPTAAQVAASGSDPVQKLTQRVADLERALRVLQRQPTTQAGTLVPTGTAREGTQYVQSGTPRLWAYSGGAWHYVGLT
jgi:hypothetical protein